MMKRSGIATEIPHGLSGKPDSNGSETLVYGRHHLLITAFFFWIVTIAFARTLSATFARHTTFK